MSLRFVLGTASIILVLNQAGLALMLVSGAPPRAALVVASLLLLLWPTLQVLRAAGVSRREGLRLRTAGVPATLLGTLTVVSILPAMAAAAERWIEHPPQLQEFLMGLASADSMPEWIAVFLSLAIVPAVCEEIFFRGFLQRSLETRLGRFAGIALATLVFGLMHGVSRAPTSIVLGGLLGILAWRTDSILPGMAAHAAVNGLLLIPVAMGQAVEPGDVSVPVGVAAVSLLATATFLSAFLTVTRGSDPIPSPTADGAFPSRPRDGDPPGAS